MATIHDDPDTSRLAETVREACIEAALAGYESAAMSGLCHEGAWEAAISAIRTADLAAAIERATATDRERSDAD